MLIVLFMGRGIKLLVLVCIFSLTTGLAFAAPKTKHEQIDTFRAHLLELKTHYGLIHYKEKVLGVNYDALDKKYTGLINKAMTLEEANGLTPPVSRAILPPEEFRQLLIGFAAEFRDGHTNITRNTPYGSTLGIEASTFGSRLIITGFNKEFYDDSGLTASLAIGDEIVEVDGIPVSTIAQENALYAPKATMQSLINWSLETAVNVPHRLLRPKADGKPVMVKVKRVEDGVTKHITGSFHWLTGKADENGFYRKPGATTPRDAEKYVYGHAGMTDSYFKEGLKHLGLPQGSIIKVGQNVNLDIKAELEALKKKGDNVVSKDGPLKEITRLEAYTVHGANGQTVGVIRIPNYSPNGTKEAQAEINWLNRVMAYMEQNTDGLIIDQVSNNGGYVFQVTEVLRTAADRELKGVTIDMKLSDTLVNNFQSSDDSSPYDDEKESRGIPGDSNFAETHLSKLDADRIRQKHEAGQDFTGPIPYMGTTFNPKDGEPGKIFAGSQQPYTKPILILNDSRSGSGGDFMPALMQANKRAVVFGYTSGGLGAPVYRSTATMPGSEMSMRCAFGMCLRSDGLPIENIGVVPEVIRAPTVTDLKGNFRPFAADALTAISGLIRGKSIAEIQAAVNEGKDLAPLFQLPEEILALDLVLPSLTNKDEVLGRLKIMRGLPQFQGDDAIQLRIGQLIQELQKSPALRFNPRCDLILDLISKK